MQWSAVFLVASLGLLTAGCGQGVFCCGKREPKPAPEPPPTKIVWDGLAEELKEVEFDIDVAVNVESVKIAVEPGEDGWKIHVTNWQELAAGLRTVDEQLALRAKHYALVYRLHEMLAARPSVEPRPDYCPVDSPEFVFFLREAQFEDWKAGDYKHCRPADCPRADYWCKDGAEPVCPNRALYKGRIEKYLKDLAKCGKKALSVRGFASSSGIRPDQRRDLLEPYRKRQRSLAMVCGEAAAPAEASASQMFNLLVSDDRARNLAKLLKAAARNSGVSIDVKPARWCSYQEMEAARGIKDTVDGGYDGFTGMLNRRAEIRVVQ